MFNNSSYCFWSSDELQLSLAGTVSHNPTDIFLGFIILTAGYNAGRFGLDRWVVPFIRKTMKTEGSKAKATA
jgi:thiosulfate dehydrogenase [quinone] large subunit